MLSLRSRIFIIASLGMLVILAIAIFLVVRKPATESPSEGTTPTDETPGTAPAPVPGGENNPAAVQGSTPATAPAASLSALEIEQRAVRQLAKLFIERSQTYSTENDFQNIKDVQALVTDRLWQKLSGRLRQPPSREFVGVTTVVWVTTLAEWSDGRATVNLQTTRDTLRAGVESRTEQRFTVTLVKQDGQWRVEGFTAVP